MTEHCFWSGKGVLQSTCSRYCWYLTHVSSLTPFFLQLPKHALDGFLWLTWLGMETPGLQTLISLGNVPQPIIGKIWRTNIPDSSSLRCNSAKASFLNYYVYCTTMLIILKKRVSKQLNKSNGKFLQLLSPLLTFAIEWTLPSCRLCGHAR